MSRIKKEEHDGECDEDFLRNFTLVEHIEKVHQGNRLFQCAGCTQTLLSTPTQGSGRFPVNFVIKRY
jgi:hypothetical protein